MIGRRAAVSAATAILGLVAVVGPQAPDPAIAIGAQRLLRLRAADATEALDALTAAIQPGLDEARRAAAAVLTGDDPPGTQLVAAGNTIAAADPEATAALSAWAGLNSARLAARPGVPPFAEPMPDGELASVGEQLGATAGAADAFVAMRRDAVELPAALESAVSALERGDLDAAEMIAARARAAHDVAAGWEGAPLSLPLWLETTDAMISAVEDIVAATRAGDAAAATAAGEAFAALADEAATADRALRIALSEGGAALTAAPLERLAAALGGIADARATAASLTEAQGR